MIKLKSYFFPIAIFVFLILSPGPVSSAGLVPCGGQNEKMCTVCDFFVLIQNIINFLLLTAASLAAFATIYIAFLFLFSGGSPAKITDAKEKLWLVVIGIAWILGSWLVLDTILNFAANKSVFPWPWNQITCQVSQLPAAISGSESLFGELPVEAMGEQEARNRFQQAGITINKSACPQGAAYQNIPGGCTSVNGIMAIALVEAAQLKGNCNCALQITGGTEMGHAQGTLSHAGGNKLDFSPNSALDSYIQNSYTYIGYRSDGAKQYLAPSGSVYAREGDHWDVTFSQ